MIGIPRKERDWIEISGEGLNLQDLVEFVKDPAGGAIVTFTGTTRADTGSCFLK
jgi:molybdopterin synthase catalytic subunit